MSDSYHTRAAIISTGDELALGQALDTNSMRLSARLWDVGIETAEHVTVGDDRAALAAAIERLTGIVPLVVVTGGLGPTLDDVTREALAEVLREPLETDARAMAILEARLRVRGRAVTENQRLQAMRPRSARCLENDNGTAPGLHAVVKTASGSCDVFCLPGPPAEMLPMVERWLVPALRIEPGLAVRTRLIQVVGLPEAEAAARLGAMMDRGANPLVGVTVSGAVLTVRARYRTHAGESDAQAILDEVEQRVRAALAPHVFARGDTSLAAAVIARLKERRAAACTVESCTGGLLAKELTDVSGSSAVFAGGWITYANEMKEALVGVPHELLRAYGAVSAEVAKAMAADGLERLRGVVGGGAWLGESGEEAESTRPREFHSLAITGIAGPDGGTTEKPVGTVWIAHAAAGPADDAGDHVDVRRFVFNGGRDEIRQRSARSALAMAWFSMSDEAGAERVRLLWEAERKP